MSNKIVWVDIPVLDLDRAIAFYSAVLGAKVTKTGGPGFQFGLFPHSGGEVAGSLAVSGTPSQNGPLIYLNADGRLAEAAAAAAEHGGSVLEPATSMGPHGFRAVILDSEGNRIGLHSMSA